MQCFLVTASNQLTVNTKDGKRPSLPTRVGIPRGGYRIVERGEGGGYVEKNGARKRTRIFFCHTPSLYEIYHSRIHLSSSLVCRWLAPFVKIRGYSPPSPPGSALDPREGLFPSLGLTLSWLLAVTKKQLLREKPTTSAHMRTRSDLGTVFLTITRHS